MQCGSSAATFQKWGGFSIYAAGPAAELFKSGTIFSLNDVSGRRTYVRFQTGSLV